MGKVVLKSNLQNLAFKKESAYVTRSVIFSRIDAKSFYEHVLRNSHIDKGQLYIASDAIGKEFKNLLCEGHSVEVPGIGTFRFGVKAKAAATAEEAGAGKVYRRRIIYTPTTEIKAILKAVELTSNIVESNTDTPAGDGE
jgi:nucleoid DNA-binding protein